MRLKDRVSKLTKSHISFPDLLYGLSSANNEPLYDVIEYLINTGFDTLSVFSLGSRCEMLPNEDSRKAIYFFLDSVRAAIPQDNLDWVITDSDSLDALTAEAEQNLMSLFSTGSLMYFKVSELLSFAPLDGFLEFLEPDTVSEEAESTISQGNNSLASYVAEYTLPQVVALILHIDLADITTTANNSYIHNQNDYDESFYHKFANLLQAYSVAALNNKIDGVDLHTRSVTPYKGDTETHVDLEKTSISRGDLDTYLASTGHELDDLIAEQVSIHPQSPPYDSLPHSFEQQDSDLVSSLQQQVAELQSRLTAAESTENSLVIESEPASIELGKYQKLLMGYPLLTAHQIACLLSNQNPVGQDYHNDDSYQLYKEMTDTAIDGRLLTVFNKKEHIAIEEVKVWLASNNIIYKGFNEDWLENACEEEDPLGKMNRQFNSIVLCLREINEENEKEVEQLASEYEELRLECEELTKQNKDIRESLEQYKQGDNEELAQHREDESKKYKSRIEELEAVIDGFSDAETLNQVGGWQLYNWKTMNVSQYPPELHLATEVWKRYYKASNTEDVTQFNTGKFNRITGELNLKDGKLKSRIRSILTPLKSKKTSTDLLATLRDVDILYNDKMPD